MNVAFLGLGGNIGNRMDNLHRTQAALNSECGTIVKVSGVYETDAWGSDSQNKYLNQVVQLETEFTVDELLEKILTVEQKLGRVRSGTQNSDRTTDIDILFYNAQIINKEHLHIPHPRLHLRKFVLIPLNEIAPDFMHPLLKKNINQLLKICSDDLPVSLMKEV